PDHLPAAEQVDVAEEFAARFVPGTDRVSRRARLAGGAERILDRRIHLPLQLQEIADGEIFGFEPAQVDTIVARGTSEMNVVISGKPFLAGLAGPTAQVQIEAQRFSCFQLEIRSGGDKKRATIGFDMVLTGGQIERRIPLQEEKVRL